MVGSFCASVLLPFFFGVSRLENDRLRGVSNVKVKFLKNHNEESSTVGNREVQVRSVCEEVTLEKDGAISSEKTIIRHFSTHNRPRAAVGTLGVL